MFGMARDLGRKKQERRVGRNQLPKGAYTLDKRLVPRVKEVNIKDNGITVSFKTPCLMKNTLYMMIYLLWTRFLQGQVAKYTLMKLWGLPRCKNLTSFPLCCRLSFSFPVLFSRFCFFFFYTSCEFHRFLHWGKGKLRIHAFCDSTFIHTCCFWKGVSVTVVHVWGK